MQRLVVCLLTSLSVGCSPAPRGMPRDLHDLESGSEHAEDLRFWLEIPDGKAVVSSKIPIRLYVEKQLRGDGKSASLLAGRLVFTFVSADPGRGTTVHSIRRDFSGGGGIDYSGETGMDFFVDAPPAAGQYGIYVTVQSTAQDVRNFLRMAKVSASAGPWWIGNRSTRPLPVSIEEAR